MCRGNETALLVALRLYFGKFGTSILAHVLTKPFWVVCGDVNDAEIDLTNANQFPYADGLLFGFPCNDFSLVGESKGLKGKFGPFYKHGITFLIS